MGYTLTEEQRELKRKAGRLGQKAQQEKYVKTKVQAKYKLEENLQFDQQLFAEVAQLKEHTTTLDRFVEGTDIPIDYDEWLFFATSVLRGSIWDKQYKDPNNDEYFLDEDREYKDKVFFEIYPDAAADSLCWSYVKFSPELNQFLIRVLEAFLQWRDRHPDQHLDHIRDIEQALRRLKNGESLFDEAVLKKAQARYRSEQEQIRQQAQEAESIRKAEEERNETPKQPEPLPDPDPSTIGLLPFYSPPVRSDLPPGAADWLYNGRKF